MALRLRRLFVPFLIIFTHFSCSPTNPGESTDETIPRDLFVQAYIELRMEALRSPEHDHRVAARDRVLSRLGVEEADLLRFVEIHGKDVQYMRSVWEEIDSILEEQRRPPS
jgi:hypothetical protein